MRRIFVMFCLLVLLASSTNAQLLIYPQGMINSRIPVIATKSGGSEGKVFSSRGVLLQYNFDQQLGDTTTGKMTLAFRVDPGRREYLPIILADKNHALAIKVSEASTGRHFQMQWMDYTTPDGRFKNEKSLEKIGSEVTPRSQWTALELKFVCLLIVVHAKFAAYFDTAVLAPLVLLLNPLLVGCVLVAWGKVC